MMKPIPRLIKSLFFVVPALIAIVSLIQTLQFPSDPKNGAILGISASRLTLLALLCVGAAALTVLAVYSWLAPARIGAWIDQRLQYRPLFTTLCLAGVVLLAGSFTILAIPDRYLHEYSALVERARPFLTWIALVDFQALLGLLVWRYGMQAALEKMDLVPPYKRILRAGMIALAVLLGLWLFVGVTKMGVWPGNAFWGKAAVPVLWPQVLLALIVSILIQLLLITRLGRPGQARWLDLGICTLLWLAAVVLWNAQSFSPGVFDSPPRPPNFQIYPTSDSQNYDLVAASELIGAPTNLAYAIDKPIYITFLVLLHLLAGTNYTNLYVLQILIFAFIPILGYLIGKTVHSRQLGIMFGILLVLREQNAIALINVIQVSTSKMILSEPLTALGLLLFTLLLVKWLKKPELSDPQLWIAGGVLGLTGLVRLNAFTVAPFAILAIGVALKFKPRPWLIASLVFAGFLLITIVPWSIESYKLTGNPLAFITGKTGGVIVDNRYSPVVEGETADASTPAPLDTPIPARALTPVPTTALAGSTPVPATAPSAKPGAGRLASYLRLANNIGQHYLHNLISMLVMLPPTAGLYDLHDMAVLLPTWALHWDGALRPDGYLMLFMVLAFVALGMGAAWVRASIAGLAPLLVILGYNISTALALTSGGRYVTPIDWGALLFFSIGTVEIAGWLAGRAGQSPDRTILPVQPVPGPARSNRLTIVLCVLLFVFIGSLPLLLEHLPPKRYSPVNKSGFEKLTTTIPALSGPTDQARIGALLKDPLSRIAHGQAFYPRYYPANLGEAGVLPQFSQVYDFDRISFTLIGPRNTFVVYPTSDPPNSFNTDAQVWVLGCHRAKYLEALIIILSDGKTTQVLQQTPLKTDCR